MNKFFKKTVLALLLVCALCALTCFFACGSTNLPNSPINPSQQGQTENNGSNNNSDNGLNGESGSQSGSDEGTDDSGTSDGSGGDESEEPSDPVIWTVGNGGSTITALTEYGKTMTELVIPEQIDEVAVTTIGEEAFKDCALLTSVTIPSSVTSIGKGAFNGCTALNSLTIPFVGASKTAENGYDQVFGYIFGYTTRSYSEKTEPEGTTCQYTDEENFEVAYYYDYYIPESLENLTIIDGNLSSGMFKNCKDLRSVTIDGDVKSIGDYAFNDCDSITTVTIGDGVENLGKGAFSYCELLSTVTLGEGITSIGYRCFYGCSHLSKIDIGSNVATIGNTAFQGCSALTSITIPSSIESIGSSAFESCHKLVEVINQSQLDIEKEKSTNGCVGKYALTIKNYGESDIENVDDYLFYNYDDVNYLLGYVGFEEEITLPESYRGYDYEMYDYAFYCNNVIKKVSVPSGINIGGYAFRNSDLIEVNIAEGVTSIGRDAFSYCRSLTSISIPDSITIVGSDAFDSCSSLEYNVKGNIKYLGNENNAYLIAIGAIDKTLTSYTIEETTLIIYSYAFAQCTSLKSITIPDSVREIGFAFSGCTALTDVTFGRGLLTISSGAFRQCTSLKSITIPDSVREIGMEAFYECTALTNVTFGRGLSYIGMNAFKQCTSLSSATFKNTSGWQYISSNYNATYEPFSATNPSENAKKLTYSGYTFKRG